MTGPERLTLVCPAGCRLVRIEDGPDGLTVTLRRGAPGPLVDIIWLNCRHRRPPGPTLVREELQLMWDAGHRGRMLAYDPDRPYYVDWTLYGYDPSAVTDDEAGEG